MTSTAIIRVDFNVPIKKGKILDNTKIKKSLATIKYVLKKGDKAVLITHLGRPKRKNKKDSTKQIVNVLSKLLQKKVWFYPDCKGKKVKEFISKKEGVILLENLRFYSSEEKNDKKFAKQLARLGDYYLNDAFGMSHRKHASVYAITRYIPSYAGLLLKREINELSKILKPKKPFIIIMGGAKVKGKIKTLEKLLPKAKYFLIGGAMAFSFLKSKGLEVGKTKTEGLHAAKRILMKYSKKIILPIDTVIANKFSGKAKNKIVKVEKIPKKWMALDIGPETIKLFKQKLSEAKTVFWNGPLGVIEWKAFEKGSKAIANYLGKSKIYTVAGGGETDEALHKFHVKLSHISTGGGASLAFLEGKELPALKVLRKT